MLTKFVAEKDGKKYDFYFRFTTEGFGEYPTYVLLVWDKADLTEEEMKSFFELRAVGCEYGVRVDFMSNHDHAQFKGKDLPDAAIRLVPGLVNDRVRSSMGFNPRDSSERRNDLAEPVWQRMRGKGLVRHVPGATLGEDYYELIEKRKSGQ